MYASFSFAFLKAVLAVVITTQLSIVCTYVQVGWVWRRTMWWLVTALGTAQHSWGHSTAQLVCVAWLSLWAPAFNGMRQCPLLSEASI